MSKRILSTLATLALLGVSAVQAARTCSPNAHQVTSLPYWNAEVTLPCMYAGTFPVKATDDQHHLFYWFFKNLTLPDTAPVVMWMNGGPGATSMFGLFLENGPLRVIQHSKALDDFTVGVSTEGSWGDVADIIFLDQPAGVGFSYYDKHPVTKLADGAAEVV